MSRKKDLPAPPPGPFNNPFAALVGKREDLPAGPAESSVPAGAPERESRGPAKAVVRYERKGHGGKEVTRIEQLGLPPEELERWLKALKQSLGCGGRVEDDAIVLQGDQRERLPVLLTARGVRKVIVG
ncbi:MAG: translation initiation factor [Myxococcaceae bacterium]